MFVITGLGLGGAEKNLVRLANKLVLNNEVTVILLTNILDNDLYEELNKNIQLKIFNFKKKINIFSSLYNFLVYLKFFNPDVVHGHMIHANLFLCILKRFRLIKLPVMITAHSNNEGKISFLYKVFAQYADLRTHVSRSGFENFVVKKLFKEKNSFYIPNCVDLQRKTAKKLNYDQDCSTPFTFILVGRLVGLKNYDFILKAFAPLVQKYNTSLKIIGDGPELLNLKKIATELKISKNVFVLGKRLDVFKQLASCDCLLIASDFEGLPMVLLEAGSVGIPFITTEVGDCGIIARETNCGFVSELKLNMYSSHMEKMLCRNKDYFKNVANFFPLYIEENFTTQSITNQYLALYNLSIKPKFPITKEPNSCGSSIK